MIVCALISGLYQAQRKGTFTAFHKMKMKMTNCQYFCPLPPTSIFPDRSQNIWKRLESGIRWSFPPDVELIVPWLLDKSGGTRINVSNVVDRIEELWESRKGEVVFHLGSIFVCKNTKTQKIQTPVVRASSNICFALKLWQESKSPTMTTKEKKHHLYVDGGLFE